MIEKRGVGHDKVALVNGTQDDGKIRGFGRVGDADVGELLVGFGEQDDNVRFACGLQGALYAHLLNAVGGFAYAGGVYEAEGDAFYPYGVFNEVARSALDVRNDGTLIVHESVHEGTFAHVGRTDDGHRDAGLQGIAGAEGIRKALYVFVESVCEFG